MRFHYRCTECGRSFARDQVRYLCPDCGRHYLPGEPLRGVLTAVFDYRRIAWEFDSNRPDWSLFSPVEPEYFPPYHVGWTPLVRTDRLAAAFGPPELYVKNDGLNPSGSLKDRASFTVVAEARRIGEEKIIAASSGNAASALAAVCAAAGTKAIIFVPAAAPRAKLVQMVLAGALVLPVRGSYDDAFRLSLECSARLGGLNRNTAYHPLTIEGKKTVALEIWAQLGFRAPDAVVVPVGDGVILAGVWKGFADLLRAEMIARLPRLVCVQAESSDAIHHYITTGRYRPAAAPNTIADSISLSAPSNAHLARQVVRESAGFSLTVSDAEILEAQGVLVRATGIFAEPAAAAAVAGYRKAAGELRGLESVVLLITGHGLKDIDAALRSVEVPPPVEPDISAVVSRIAAASSEAT